MNSMTDAINCVKIIKVLESNLNFLQCFDAAG